MINFNDLVLEEKTVGEFFQFAYLFNLERAKNDSHTLFDTRGFFSYMKGLSEFGKMVFTSKLEISLYKKIAKEDPYIRTKYYAIDKSGLSIGFIYAPNEKGIQDYVNPPRDSYYGFCTEEHKCTYVYDCYVLNNSDEKGLRNFVELEELRANYLPLPSKSNYFDGIVYYQTSNKLDSNFYGPTIYKSKTRSFYLPFVELIKGHLNIHGWTTLIISPSFEKDFISFTAVHCFPTRKHDNSNTYIGKISYDKFDIIEMTCTERTSEYNW